MNVNLAISIIFISLQHKIWGELPAVLRRDHISHPVSLFETDINDCNSLHVLAGCYGTLGLESGGVADTQLSASSVWEWSNIIGQHSVWAPSGARLKKAGPPWAPSQSDQQQWLQIDLKREKRWITGTQLYTLKYIL